MSFFLAKKKKIYENKFGDSMTKKEVFIKLKEINEDKKNILVVGKTSLVCHGVINKCDDIETINIKDKDDEYDEIEGFLVLSLKSCLKKLKLANNKDEKSLVKKIELFLDCQDTYKNERELLSEGYTLIGGVDEVGRGPLVGPVVAACCILPKGFRLDGLTDSKKLSEKKRNYYFEEIKKQAISFGIGIVDEKRIDEINIYEATKEAMYMAYNEANKKVKIDYILIDAMPLVLDVPNTSIIKGDSKSISIAAASVVAKVTRDRMMYELDKKYPEYGFSNHKGYPTKKHIEAINKYGLIDGYRKTYGPVKDIIERVKL